METKWTPGPWKVGKDIFGQTFTYDNSGARISNERAFSPDEWNANAYLIATAPELYEALEDTLGSLDDVKALLDQDDTLGAWSIIDSILQDHQGVLAKARGEQTND